MIEFAKIVRTSHNHIIAGQRQIEKYVDIAGRQGCTYIENFHIRSILRFTNGK